MKKVKKITALCAAILTASAAVPYDCMSAYAVSGLISLPDTDDIVVTVNADEHEGTISRYIYGINDNDNISGINPVVIKQSDDALSAYNWETNYSNTGKNGLYTNDVSLIAGYSADNWKIPALYTKTLVERAKSRSIPVRLVTLPMMGYVANDAMGTVSQGESSRWAAISFKKNEPYSIIPDTTDNTVYIDEYVNYLVSAYGTASEGGINGYFLDSEPELWHEKFSVLELEPISPEELVRRSSQLASSIKDIDSRAYVFGPSLSGLEGCIHLNDTSSWSEAAYSDDSYSWFIDYYLSEMKKSGEEYGSRLLDVLDIHYYTEAQTPSGELVLYNNDDISNAYRMQAVRLLWDSEYTEMSKTLLYKQFTPLIPMLQASIRMYYPKTRLSFSEYDFGGGTNISGTIAQVDALGTFAREGVYLACLSPVSGDYSYQKAAINLFTDYDGDGSGFGDIFVSCSNEDDIMSSVYAAADSNDSQKLNIILTNKNYENEKIFTVNIASEIYDYEITGIYGIDDELPEIISHSPDISISDNSFNFTAEPTSVYLITLSGQSNIPVDIEDEPTETDYTDSSETSPSSEILISETNSIVTEYSTEMSTSKVTEKYSETTIDPVEETVPDLTETTMMYIETNIPQTEQTTADDILISDFSTAPDDTTLLSEKGVSLPIKIIVTIFACLVGAGVVYILVFDKR